MESPRRRTVSTHWGRRNGVDGQTAEGIEVVRRRRDRLSGSTISRANIGNGHVSCRTASDVGVEAAWAPCLLRDYRERPEPGVVQLPRRSHLAEVAQPAVAKAGDAMDTVPPSPRALSASTDDGEALGHPSVAKPSVEEPDAEEPARPDLGGAGSATTLVYPTPIRETGPHVRYRRPTARLRSGDRHRRRSARQVDPSSSM